LQSTGGIKTLDIIIIFIYSNIMKQENMQNQDVNAYAKMFKALAHPLRLKIVCGLMKKESCDVGTMSEHLKVPQPTVSQHLCILKKPGVIEGCRKANRICYKVKSESAKKMLENIKIDFCGEKTI